MNSGVRLLISRLVCVGGIALSGCAYTHKVVPVSKAGTGDYVYYALPRTVVMATALVSVSTVDPAPPCGNLEKYLMPLGLERPKISAGKFMTVHKTSLERRSEPDPEERYAVRVSGTGNSELALELNARGALTKGSSESRDIIVPTVVGALEMAASIAGKLFGASKDQREELCDGVKVQLDDLRRRLLELDSSPGAADPKEILEYKAARLQLQAKVLEAMFTGVKPGAPQKIVCDVRPKKVVSSGNATESTTSSDYTLFTWTVAGGIDPSAASVPEVECDIPAGLSIGENDRARGSDRTVSERIRAKHSAVLGVGTRHSSDLVSVPESTPRSGERGFYYRIPAFRTLEVLDRIGSDRSERISDRVEWAIPQLGSTRSLPRLRSTGSAKVSVTLDPDTGALLAVMAKEEQADFDAAAGRLGKSIAGVLEARTAAKDDDELERLKREQAILEAQVAIDAAREALKPD